MEGDGRVTSSVPANENAAVTKTVHMPWKPFASEPGSCHKRAPQYSPNWPDEGPPPRTKTRDEITKIMIIVSLRQLDQNSSSANPRVLYVLSEEIGSAQLTYPNKLKIMIITAEFD